MEVKDVKKNIESSLGKLQDLAEQRDSIEHQMGRLHMAIRALSNLVDNRAEREAYTSLLERYAVRTGVTDLVMYCLNTTGVPQTPGDIRDFIKNYGSEASFSQNLLQSVHTILKRLEEAGKIKPVSNEDGDKAYRPVTIGERLMERGFDQGTATVTERSLGWLGLSETPSGSLRAAVRPRGPVTTAAQKTILPRIRPRRQSLTDQVMESIRGDKKK